MENTARGCDTADGNTRCRGMTRYLEVAIAAIFAVQVDRLLTRRGLDLWPGQWHPGWSGRCLHVTHDTPVTL